MDRILLKNLRFSACHGVFDFEKQTPQPFELDIELEADLQQASRSDALRDTVDYGLVHDIALETATARHFDLIEALAGHVGRAILAAFPAVQAAEVTVRKPHAPVEGTFDYMGVTIRSQRD